MERLDGGQLESLIYHKPRPTWDEVRKVICEIGEALGMHTQRIDSSRCEAFQCIYYGGWHHKTTRLRYRNPYG